MPPAVPASPVDPVTPDPVTPDPVAPDPVTLDNCAREPIHIPASVQPHGALLAFGPDGRLRYRSDNAQALLGSAQPALGEPVDAAHFGAQAAIAQALREAAQPDDEGVLAQQLDVTLEAGAFDLIVHRTGDCVVAEFEQRADAAGSAGAFAVMAHRGMDKLRRQSSLQALLDVAVAEVRRITGFDRVMAYRFRDDASGDVVAEARREDLGSFLHQRYPAGDIPAQARRLYVINTLRLIADVGARPVAVRATCSAPLDMSHCVLRSVSPVHIEYLTNMGVRASMSVSIVINGQLWGMLACHHMTPRLVPYAVRMACDVMAQILAANVQSVLAAAHGERIQAAAALRSGLVERMLHSDDATQALAANAGALMRSVEADAAIFVEDGKLTVHGDIAPEAARAFVDWLDAEPALLQDNLLARNSLASVPPLAASGMDIWCGFLAMRYDAFANGWLVLLRKEQIETVAWGGRPEKTVAAGPLGARLTPRGSFDVWRETVRGTAVAWSVTDLEIARSLLDEMMRAASARHAELNRAKDQMMAMLGHDLRNPLQTISMAAHVLGRSVDSNAAMSRRIQSSSTRMQRLISQVLDMSRLQSGLGLGFQLAPVDLSRLVDDLVEEIAIGHPDTAFDRHVEPGLFAPADPDRTAQLMINLLSNARHHGARDGRVHVLLRAEGGQVVFEVANRAAPIAPDLVAQLFAPYKRGMGDNLRNKGGLGIGLYIAHEIAVGQGGALAYHYDHARGAVVFTARFVAATMTAP